MTDKQETRLQIKRMKETLDNRFVKKNSHIITDKLMQMEEFKRADNVMCYLSFGNEVDTSDIVETCLKEGKRLFIPVIVKNNTGTSIMEASKLLDPIKDLCPGTMGILEPREDKLRIANPESIDFIVIPGLAFDREGGRLGYGRGYYDGFLPRLKKDCFQMAVAFSFQVIDKVPTDDKDKPVSRILTERELIAIY